MVEKTYCKSCKILIKPGNIFGGGDDYIEFEEGVYCVACAKVRKETKKEKIEASPLKT